MLAIISISRINYIDIEKRFITSPRGPVFSRRGLYLHETYDVDTFWNRLDELPISITSTVFVKQKCAKLIVLSRDYTQFSIYMKSQ